MECTHHLKQNLCFSKMNFVGAQGIQQITGHLPTNSDALRSKTNVPCSKVTKILPLLRTKLALLMWLFHITGQGCFLIQNQENFPARCTGRSGESQVSPAGQPLPLNGKDQSRIYAFCIQACSGGESGSSWTFPKFRSQINFPPFQGRATEG